MGEKFGLKTSKFYCKPKILHDRILPFFHCNSDFYFGFFTCLFFFFKTGIIWVQRVETTQVTLN